MSADKAKLGARVRRIKDNSCSEPGAVLRVMGQEVRVFWPSDNVLENVPIADLEMYDSEPVAA